jgi:hypothetical protein
MSKQYRVRLNSGKIIGPLDLQEIKTAINTNRFKSNVDFQYYPVGDWNKIESFNEIIDYLSQDMIIDQDKEKTILINVGSKTPSAELNEIAHVVDVGSAGSSSFVPDLIVALTNLGLRKVTCEGGPSLLTQLMDASAIDEYDLTVSPVTVGGSPAWPGAVPHESNWDLVGTAISGDFEFKRLLLRR